MERDSIEEALLAYLVEDEPTSIMSIQLLREKLAESVVPEAPETEPATPDAIRRKGREAIARSGTRPKATLGSYLELDLVRRKAR